MIPQAEVFRLAHRYGVGERVIEKDYVLSWVLVAIVVVALKETIRLMQEIDEVIPSCPIQ